MTPQVTPQPAPTESVQEAPKTDKCSKTWHGHKLVRTKKFYDAETFFGIIKK